LRSVPEKVDGGALKHGEKEKHDANSCGEHHSGVKNVGVDAVHGDSEKGDDNREFGGNASHYVEELSYPPALEECELATST
jgi:hypothetical protein